MKVWRLGIVPAVLMMLTPTARADKSGVTPEAQTRAALKRLAGLYGPAWTLTYESVITMRQFGAANGAQSVQATVHGVVQKPNKFRLEVMQNDKIIGLLVSDGSNAYAYNPVQAVYRRQAAPTDLALGGILTPDKALARLVAVVPAMAMTPTLFSLATRPDFLGTDATAFSARSLTLHGKQALDCSWTEDGATEHIFFNEATGLPLRTIDSGTDKAGTTTERQEDLTAIQVGAVPLPASAFAWTPPPGAKAAVDDTPATALPALTSPKPAPVTHHRRHRLHSDTGDRNSGKTPTDKIIRPQPSNQMAH